MSGVACPEPGGVAAPEAVARAGTDTLPLALMVGLVCFRVGGGLDVGSRCRVYGVEAGNGDHGEVLSQSPGFPRDLLSD